MTPLVSLRACKEELEALNAAQPSDVGNYFLQLVNVMQDKFDDLPPDKVDALDAFIASKPGAPITPFLPDTTSIKSMLGYMTALTHGEYARKPYGDKISRIFQQLTKTLPDELRKTYGDRFAAMEPVLLHELALAFSARRAAQKLQIEELNEVKEKVPFTFAKPTGPIRQKNQSHYEMTTIGDHALSLSCEQGDTRTTMEDMPMQLLVTHEAPSRDMPGNMVRAFAAAETAFSTLKQAKRDGTTGTVANITDGVATVANVGDSRAFVLLEPITASGDFDPTRQVEYKRLSAEHQPADVGEILRIEAVGGKLITGHYRSPDYSRVLSRGEMTAGDLSNKDGVGLGTARALGDRDMAPFVSSTPEITQTDLKPYLAEKKYRAHLCLCTDGAHWAGWKDKNCGFQRGLWEKDYAALLKAYREDPAASKNYPNLAQYFNDGAGLRDQSDNRTFQVISWNPDSKTPVTAGVFDGHGSMALAREAAKIVGQNLGIPDLGISGELEHDYPPRLHAAASPAAKAAARASFVKLAMAAQAPPPATLLKKDDFTTLPVVDPTFTLSREPHRVRIRVTDITPEQRAGVKDAVEAKLKAYAAEECDSTLAAEYKEVEDKKQLYLEGPTRGKWEAATEKQMAWMAASKLQPSSPAAGA